MICYNKGYPLGLISSGSVFGVKCISTCDVMYAFYFLIKVAQPSIFIRPPSIFDPSIPKQLDSNSISIITHGLHID